MKEASILIIEDDDRIRTSLRDILLYGGYRVLEATDGKSGLEMLEKDGLIGMVFTDLGMPGMNGWEVARMTKEKAPQLPVILITGWRLSPDETKIRESGIDRIIRKPFQVDEILDTARVFVRTD